VAYERVKPNYIIDSMMMMMIIIIIIIIDVEVPADRNVIKTEPEKILIYKPHNIN
jgi:hypothetical protein